MKKNTKSLKTTRFCVVFKYLSIETISYGDFCWNGDCLNCQVWIKNGDKEKALMTCRAKVEEGMEICTDGGGNHNK